jgi:hypothetical protein
VVKNFREEHLEVPAGWSGFWWLMLKLASKGHVGNQRNTMEKTLFHSFVISDQSVCQVKPSHSLL